MSAAQDWHGPYTANDLADEFRFPSDQGFWELEEGYPVMSPWHGMDHDGAIVDLRRVLEAAAEKAGADVHISMIRINTAEGGSRVPDLSVVDGEAQRAARRAKATTMDAADVILVVEFVSPSNVARDHVTKRREYARSGIPYYWIVDLEPVPAITALTLHGTEYALQCKAEGDDELVVEKPFAVRISPVRLAEG
ncbi:Uma2 family endonuclease [Nonomuraea typhae]|uniref:Uma2 family endonuclease n=1 Tax=Nonomuraea typhae TaxID=2603600 RepID=UPI0012F780C6|nr:Uma2 family endonuclease [Nonomuraea typhae]